MVRVNIEGYASSVGVGGGGGGEGELHTSESLKIQHKRITICQGQAGKGS